MKLTVPFEFTDVDRLRIARFLGYHEPATREQCIAFAREHLRGSLNLMAKAASPCQGVIQEPIELLTRGKP